MISGDLLVVAVICKKTSGARKAAKEGGLKRSLSVLLFRNGILHFVILSFLNLVHLACIITNFFPSFMATVGEALTSIVVSRYILNLRNYNRPSVMSNITFSSRMSQSIQFVTSRSINSDSNPVPPQTGDSFCRRLVDFVEPLGAPVEGFLGAGLTREEDGDVVREIRSL
ncbi:hypothetical protein BD309DRAFT_1020538 [Dichomitus squalens]|uniref:Uncharacterized protein n=2 Tax=Dichomitus squalens TaxID=114155 RepID=A0A4Q9MZF9_9APHY|nr:uncharacterized protein DICSQDRAFT_173722 [Dichomitus squalens LYAD-421 SS1]EJF57616.1 hypothetical protein DICSQDRAFT_173722 [Dichomitus squalens LYAD-421 SS1]TBU31746.1 hypothetical protein BD311DRAFT_804545 [Dichomitus squalens]TBU41678.1 hypothetical protein BD309DRAFT_1020538 [Dichomitus squalens]